VTVYRNTISKALREELGTAELTKLTAGGVQKALANLAARRSARTVQMAGGVHRPIAAVGRSDRGGAGTAVGSGGGLGLWTMAADR
jgi:hypothetical protein